MMPVRLAIRALLVALALPMALAATAQADESPDAKAPKAQTEDPVVAKARALRERGDAHQRAQRSDEAIASYQAAIELMQSSGGDHEELALALNELAFVLHSLGRPKEAVPSLERALSIRERLFDGQDHPALASSLNNLAAVLDVLGRAREALPYYKRALSMHQRLFEGDHPRVAMSLIGLTGVLYGLGKARESLPYCEQALSMSRRLFGADHPHVATSLNNLAAALVSLGRTKQALPHLEQALSMTRRSCEGDHPDVAISLNNLAHVLDTLGRAREALQYREQTLSMYRRLEDHLGVAASMNNLASSLAAIGKPREALPYYRDALSIRRRLHEGDHPDVAASLNNLATVLGSLGKAEEALLYSDHALVMYQRLFEGDHPLVAKALTNLATVLCDLGKARRALPHLAQALSMHRRLFGEDHPDVVGCLSNLAHLLVALDRRGDAQATAEEAIQIGERIRWLDRHEPRVLLGELHVRERDFLSAIRVLKPAAEQLAARRRAAAALGSEGRATYVAHLRRRDPYPPMIHANVALGRADDAFGVLEQSRGREMLDLLQRGEGDPLEAAKAVARNRGDERLLARIQEMAFAVHDSASAVAIATTALERARARGLRRERATAKAAVVSARAAHERALRERLAVIQDVLPEGRPLDAKQAKALLGEGEIMLAYGLGEHSFLLALSRDDIRAYALQVASEPASSRMLAEDVAAYREALSLRGRTPLSVDGHPGAALFRTLVPDDLWVTLKDASRVYVLPHGVLHQLPFEALVVGTDGDKPVYWAQEGPPIAYAASAAVLSALKARPKTIGPLSVVAVGDPVFENVVQWPNEGVVIKDVAPDSQGAKAELRPGDVITAYGATKTATYKDLMAAIRGTDPASEEISLTVEREGAIRTAALKPGKIGVYLAQEPPQVAGPKVLANLAPGVLRGGRLARLPGTGDEVRAIQKLLEEQQGPDSLKVLLREQATEAALFEAANSPRVLHVATHGLIEPDQGARASRLALTPPRVPRPDNDGFLSLGDLLERWRSRLEGTELVVLSACESHAGKLDQNEGMLALPWGFCFAGARSCIASLWQVDDKSTAKLMTSLYQHMAQGGRLSPCEALHAARQELMKTHPDPYYWAPFLFAGAP